MSVRAAIERFLSPGLSRCYRCGRPWKTPATRYRGFTGGVHHYEQLKRLRWRGLIGVESHTTNYGDGRGCFPLCEGCWAALTPDERWPFYAALIAAWQRDLYVGATQVAEIRDAVEAGK